MLNQQVVKVRSVALLLIFFIIISSLGVSGKAWADPSPPASSYSGPLTWTAYTEPSIGTPYITYSLAIDGDDNIYVNKFTQPQLSGSAATVTPGRLERISGADKTVTDITYDSNVTFPIGIAVDINQNIYVTDNSSFGNELDTNTPRIIKLEQGDDQWQDITYGEELRYAMGIAADHQGNVYAVESSNTNSGTMPAPRILKLPYESDDSDPRWEDITGSAFEALPNVIVFDIVVDGGGNLFIGVLGNSTSGGKILKLPASDNGTADWIDVTPPVTDTPFNPYGMSVDSGNNLFVVNYMSGSVSQLFYNGDVDDWITINAVPAMQYNIFDVAADSSGNLFGTNPTNGTISTLRAVIMYNGNNPSVDLGSVPVDSLSYQPNETATVLGSGEMQRAGYRFAGWSTSADAIAAEYAPGDTIPMTQSRTLYAVWEQLPDLAGIAVEDGEVTLSVGATKKLVVSAAYSDNSTMIIDSGITFHSDNEDVAVVDDAGLITAKSSGQAVITAEYEGEEATATVTVQPGYVHVPLNSGIEIIIDGVKQDQLAISRNSVQDGRGVTTIVLDNEKVIRRLDQGHNQLLTIPVQGNNQVIHGQLNGSLVKSMENRNATIRIETDKATYSLPAAQIHIDNLLNDFGSDINLEDLIITIKISVASEEDQEQLQAAANDSGAEVVGELVDFEVQATYGSQSVQVNRFNSYVEREIAIPEELDPSKITTGVVLTSDGQLFHIPTVVTERDGRSYASMKSLTNSAYSLIYHSREMKDVAHHWSKEDVNDMSSRLIIKGITQTEFDPDSFITRAEFAAVVTRALGIQDQSYENIYPDVRSNDWFSGAIQTAMDYELILGYEDGLFRPDANISRQEATVMLARAARIAGLNIELHSDEISRVLSRFMDREEIAAWATYDAASIVSLDLLKGRDGQYAPQSNLTRAETAALVKRLLQAASLIN